MKFTEEQIRQLNEELPTVAVAGPWGGGKSLFGITRPVLPDSRVIWLHTEPSGANYAALYAIDRVEINSMPDLRQAMTDMPNVAHIIVDTIAPIENWLYQDVLAGVDLYGSDVKPGDAKRFAKDAAAAWGEMKNREIVLLTKMLKKADAVTITSHMRARYIGNRPSGTQEPRVKDVVNQFVSLFLILQRDNGPGAPSAEVLKSTLIDKAYFAETGEPRPVLPPRLPIATWETIWKYIENPIDAGNLAPEEESRAMTDEETLRLVASLVEESAE